MAVQARHRVVSLLLAAFLATACGSTVQGSSAQLGPTAVAGGDGLGSPGGASPSPTGGGSAPGATGGSLVAGPPGAASLPATGGGTTGGGTGSAVAGGGVGTVTSGPGVTAKEVYVGLLYDKNADALNSAAGIGAISSGDSKANTEAIINDINKHGGVGGRKLVPVYANFDSTSTQTLAQQYAAVCQQFTHDTPRVFAVEGAIGDEAFRQCLSKAGVAILSASLPSLGQADLLRYPGLIEQGYANVDRLAAYQVTPLVQQQYFTPWDSVNGRPAATGTVKVGILTYDDRVFANAVDRYLVPALKRLGYDPQVARIAQITTAADYGSQGAAVKSAELSFAANGVTHVIPFESNGGLSTFFLPNARSQHYYPRYGISSASAYQALLDAGLVENKQMTGAVGFGWIPVVDLHASDDPDNGPYSNVSRRHCVTVMKDSGITFTSGNAEGIALNSCATLYLLKTALDRTPAQITLGTFIGKVESLGTSYQNPGGLGQEFRPGRHDPSNKAYHWRYVEGCTCFRYEGTLQTVP